MTHPGRHGGEGFLCGMEKGRKGGCVWFGEVRVLLRPCPPYHLASYIHTQKGRVRGVSCNYIGITIDIPRCLLRTRAYRY